MSMSSFFRALRASYQSEIDDLTFDSDGKNVLQQRLDEKRRHMTFLLQMMEISPEMVAVAFHGGFHFELPGVMDRLLTLESDEFPPWDSLADAVQLAAWAQELAKVILQEPHGDWFMTVTAGLEYLYHRPSPHQNSHSQDEHRPANVRDLDHGQDFNADDDHHDDTDHEETSADWLEGQGFDRKN